MILNPKGNNLERNKDLKGCCQVCFVLIEAEVMMCSTCSSIYCQLCLEKMQKKDCATCRRSCNYVRNRHVEDSIREMKLASDLKCEKHEYDLFYFCLEENC